MPFRNPYSLLPRPTPRTTSKAYAIIFISSYKCNYVDVDGNATNTWKVHRTFWNEAGFLVCGKTPEPVMPDDPEVSHMLLNDDAAATPSDRLVYRSGYNPSRLLVMAVGDGLKGIYPKNDPDWGFNPIRVVKCPSVREPGYYTVYYHTYRRVAFNMQPGFDFPLTAEWLNEQFHDKFPNITDGDTCWILIENPIDVFTPENRAIADLASLNPGINFKFRLRTKSKDPLYWCTPWWNPYKGYFYFVCAGKPIYADWLYLLTLIAKYGSPSFRLWDPIDANGEWGTDWEPLAGDADPSLDEPEEEPEEVYEDESIPN